MGGSQGSNLGEWRKCGAAGAAQEGNEKMKKLRRRKRRVHRKWLHGLHGLQGLQGPQVLQEAHWGRRSKEQHHTIAGALMWYAGDPLSYGPAHIQPQACVSTPARCTHIQGSKTERTGERTMWACWAHAE
eukprot:gene13342-biopygen15574